MNIFVYGFQKLKLVLQSNVLFCAFQVFIRLKAIFLENSFLLHLILFCLLFKKILNHCKKYMIFLKIANFISLILNYPL